MSRDYRPLKKEGTQLFFARTPQTWNVNAYGVEFWGRVFGRLLIDLPESNRTRMLKEQGETPQYELLPHGFVGEDWVKLRRRWRYIQSVEFLIECLRVNNEMTDGLDLEVPAAEQQFKQEILADWRLLDRWIRNYQYYGIASDYFPEYKKDR